MDADGNNAGAASDTAEDNDLLLASPTAVSILNRLVQMQRAGLNPAGITRSTILDILRRLQEDPPNRADNEDDDDEDSHDDDWGSRFPQVTKPMEQGVELLYSGAFGRIANKIRTRADNPNRNIAQAIRRRNEGRRCRSAFTRQDITSNLVPNSNGTAVAKYAANIYTAQYSADSSLYYTCSQDFRLYIYDPYKSFGRGNDGIDAAFDRNINTTMTVKRRIQGAPGRWTITDANLSPDNQRLIYSSITPTIYMTSTVDENPIQHPITFSGDHGLYSCTFSADGNEIIAGGNGNIFVYDLLSDRETVNIHAHNDDVNSCCWADTASGNILVSASDDSFLKVWDRRSLGTSPKPSGVLIGHTEGITYVFANGDGRYVISNGKDQAVRLWDLRKMRSPMEHENVRRKSYGIPGFDYRYPPYEKPRHEKHPLDCSVMTYRGHSVIRTLIRCKFSPMESTGSQYIYSGSADGRIHVWSLDGTIAQVLDRTRTLSMSLNPSSPEDREMTWKKRRVCVRDVSWHANEPVMMSAAWEPGSGMGSILARHEWKGLNKMRGSVKDWVEKERAEALESERRSRGLSQIARRDAQRQMPGTFLDEDDASDSDYMDEDDA